MSTIMDAVSVLLEECKRVHQSREHVHGYDEHYEDAARIATVMLSRHFHGYEIAVCALAMKLVRYAHQINSTMIHGQSSHEVTKDTAIDAINYIALAERERIKHVNKERTIATPKEAPEPGDRGTGHTDLSGIKPFVQQSSPKEGTGQQD